MVQQWKELRDVKSHHASLETLCPPSLNDMSEEETSILGRPLPDTTKLVRIEHAVLDAIKLKTRRKHLLIELPQGV